MWIFEFLHRFFFSSFWIEIPQLQHLRFIVWTFASHTNIIDSKWLDFLKFRIHFNQSATYCLCTHFFSLLASTHIQLTNYAFNSIWRIYIFQKSILLVCPCHYILKRENRICSPVSYSRRVYFCLAVDVFFFSSFLTHTECVFLLLLYSCWYPDTWKKEPHSVCIEGILSLFVCSILWRSSTAHCAQTYVWKTAWLRSSFDSRLFWLAFLPFLFHA